MASKFYGVGLEGLSKGSWPGGLDGFTCTNLTQSS